MRYGGIKEADMADQHGGSFPIEMGGMQTQSLKKILSNTINTIEERPIAHAVFFSIFFSKNKIFKFQGTGS